MNPKELKSSPMNRVGKGDAAAKQRTFIVGCGWVRNVVIIVRR